MFETIKEKNQQLKCFDVYDETFGIYGKIIKENFTVFDDKMEDSELPEHGNCYVPSYPKIDLPEFQSYFRSLYGGMDIQIGYSNGRNSNLNGLEYHKSSEVNIAITDMFLILGHIRDIENNEISVEQLKGFFIPKGTAIEIYQTTLHFAPCKVTDNGYKCVVVLPKGTNEKLVDSFPVNRFEDKLLFMKNKWLLAHPENARLIDQGAYPGIKGENLKILY
ncbi:DUF4867 family protein [Scopulibacillus cellulosilyticus]|uniref:DUF4867 family protein n=1 Tax=Scopulibacillus cellulosilyticus TaxID=2665665 RepID=A0ABW2PZB2_9BACL